MRFHLIVPLVLTIVGNAAFAQTSAEPTEPANGVVVAKSCSLSELKVKMGRKWPKNGTINLVFHGHSVPSGYHKTPEVKPFESYPHLVHRWIKERYPHAVVNVIVTAIGGEDSVAGAARFKRDVMSLKPDLVFVDYALNDRRKPADQVETSWRMMIDQAKKARVPIVLLTPTGDAAADLSNHEDPLRERADLIRRLAMEEKVLLADVSAKWMEAIGKGTPQDQLLSQPNHPNLQGHAVATAAIVETLEADGLSP